MKPKIIISKKDEKILWTAVNEETIQFILDRVIPSGSDYVFMYDNASNIERSFTFCYDFNFNDENGATAIPIFNVEKGKELFLQYLRYKRNKLFPELDLQYMRALETGNQSVIQEIVAKKQQLRDLPDMDFSNVLTPIQIKEKWPTDILGEIPF